ncbi:MAG: LytTR family transcriptional regulator [Alphaproteobacteria bacterium]|jgi:hypothetical protein|nr:LytTR family transcriptional regulator [Alphaproteobacteria bacterium]
MTKIWNKYPFHKFIKENYSYMIILITCFLTEIFIKVSDYLEDPSYNKIEQLLHAFEIPMFILSYIFIENKIKHVIKNKFIKAISIISIISIVFCSMQLAFFHFIGYEENFDIKSEVLLESTEIFFFLSMVALINFINKKFLLSHILEGDRGFLAKIPEHKRDSIFMIKSNENYIEVFFEDKIETINYRLKDAIKEMPANMGIQIHKSYWINKSYFKEISKKNNKNYITLTNSLEIPIGGTFLALIKENFKKI